MHALMRLPSFRLPPRQPRALTGPDIVAAPVLRSERRPAAGAEWWPALQGWVHIPSCADRRQRLIPSFGLAGGRHGLKPATLRDADPPAPYCSVLDMRVAEGERRNRTVSRRINHAVAVGSLCPEVRRILDSDEGAVSVHGFDRALNQKASPLHATQRS